MACQVLRCGRPAEAPGTPVVPAPRAELDAFALCPDHRRAIDDGAPWSVDGPATLLVGPDALYELPRVVKRLRAGVAEVVQVVGGRAQGLVELQLTVGLEGTRDHDRDLRLVLPADAARALGAALPELADDAELAAGT